MYKATCTGGSNNFARLLQARAFWKNFEDADFWHLTVAQEYVLIKNN